MKGFPCFIFHCVQGIKLVLSSYYTMATHAYYQPFTSTKYYEAHVLHCCIVYRVSYQLSTDRYTRTLKRGGKTAQTYYTDINISHVSFHKVRWLIYVQ